MVLLLHLVGLQHDADRSGFLSLLNIMTANITSGIVLEGRLLGLRTNQCKSCLLIEISQINP